MLPTTEQIEAAAADLRAINAPRTPGDIWDRYPTETVYAMRYTAQVVLADAWLAATADDGDPLPGLDTDPDSPLRAGDPLRLAAHRAVACAESYPFAALAGDAAASTVLLLYLKGLARWFRRERPADDAEPATACWVMAALPADAGYPGRPHASHPGKLATLSWHCGQEYRPGPADRAANFRLCVNGVEIDWRAATKGQLRRLFAALGVPAAEGGASCPS